MTASAPACIDSHRPKASVHAARCRGGIVILNAERDLYQGFYLADDGNGARVAEGLANVFPEVDIQQLVSQAPPVSGGVSDPDRQECEPDWTARLRVRDVALFVGTLLFCSVRFHSLTFARLVRQPGRPRPAASGALYRTAVARFRRMSALVPFSMQCLFRSHFLLYFLRGYGLAADWVFGVSLFPFQAHCWLAVGPMTLLDRAEKTEDFVPVLTVLNLACGPA
jgi:hypothetical protein